MVCDRFRRIDLLLRHTNETNNQTCNSEFMNFGLNFEINICSLCSFKQISISNSSCLWILTYMFSYYFNLCAWGEDQFFETGRTPLKFWLFFIFSTLYNIHYKVYMYSSFVLFKGTVTNRTSTLILYKWSKNIIEL